jgi:polyhydroxyalkanoate synthesis regulator phasin
MAETNFLKRYLDAGMAFTQLTQARAEAIVKDLVNAGEVQTGQAQATVADLIERSRENTERLLAQVRRDLRDQVSNLGLATKADIARLERQIASVKSPGNAASKSTKKAPAKKAAKRSPSKKAAKNARP